MLPFHSQTPLVSELAHQFPVDTPEVQGCLSLSYSGNPGVNGVSDRGANWTRLGQGEFIDKGELRVGECFDLGLNPSILAAYP